MMLASYGVNRGEDYFADSRNSAQMISILKCQENTNLHSSLTTNHLPSVNREIQCTSPGRRHAGAASAPCFEAEREKSDFNFKTQQVFVLKTKRGNYSKPKEDVVLSLKTVL